MFVLIGAVLATAGPSASDREPREMTLDAFSVGDRFWFEFAGGSAKNPTISLVPGETVKVTLRNVANEGHNIRIGHPVDEEMPIQEPGRQDTIRVQVPADADGAAAYWCQPHESLGMRGIVRYVRGDAEESPAGWMPLVLTGFLLVGLVRQRVPSGT